MKDRIAEDLAYVSEQWALQAAPPNPSPAVPPEGLDVEALATALERTYHGSHPSSARREDWLSDASFVADEYAAVLDARVSEPESPT